MFTRIKYKLLLYFLVLGILPLIAIMLVEYYKHIDALKERSFNQLKTIRGIKKREVETYFSRTREELLLFAQSKSAIEALKSFKQTFHSIKGREVPADFDAKLKAYYNTEYKSNIVSGEKDTINIDSLVPANYKSIFLQTQYLIGNKYLQKEHPYHKVHETYHSTLSEFVTLNGFYDLFLIDDSTGHIVYSVTKETDFATSLLTDAHSNSNLGKLFRSIRYSGAPRHTILCDFERYMPSYMAPASFMATPVFDGKKRIGTLAIQISIDKVDAITTNKKIWREEGLGESGECYIVGNDCKMRTNSRFILETPNEFFQDMKENTYDSLQLHLMKFYKTTVLFQIACNVPIIKSGANQSGVAIVNDYRGTEVLSAYANLNVKDVHWSILSEMDTSEAFASIISYQRRSVIIASVLLIVLIIASILIARSIYKPINKLVEGAQQLGAGNLQVRVEVDTKDELKLLADTFNKAVAALNENRNEILENNQLLEEQKEEIASQSDRLAKLNSEILENNSLLDRKVSERTEDLRRMNKRLLEYAFFNSHKLRGPVATILGLMSLIKLTDSIDEKLKCIELLEKSTTDLDNVIHEIQKILDAIEFTEES